LVVAFGIWTTGGQILAGKEFIRYIDHGDPSYNYMYGKITAKR